MSVLKFSCQHCGAKLKAPAGRVGKSLPCPKCGQRITVIAEGVTPKCAEATSATPPAKPGSDSAKNSSFAAPLEPTQPQSEPSKARGEKRPRLPDRRPAAADDTVSRNAGDPPGSAAESKWNATFKSIFDKVRSRLPTHDQWHHWFDAAGRKGGQWFREQAAESSTLMPRLRAILPMVRRWWSVSFQGGWHMLVWYFWNLPNLMRWFIVRPIFERFRFLSSDREIVLPESDFCCEVWDAFLPKRCVICGNREVITCEEPRHHTRTLSDVRRTAPCLMAGVIVACLLLLFGPGQMLTMLDRRLLSGTHLPVWFCLRLLLPFGALLTALVAGYRLRREQSVEVKYHICRDHERNVRYPQLFVVGGGLLLRLARTKARIVIQSGLAQIDRDRERQTRPAMAPVSVPTSIPLAETSEPTPVFHSSPPESTPLPAVEEHSPFLETHNGMNGGDVPVASPTAATTSLAGVSASPASDRDAAALDSPLEVPDTAPEVPAKTGSPQPLVGQLFFEPGDSFRQWSDWLEPSTVVPTTHPSSIVVRAANEGWSDRFSSSTNGLSLEDDDSRQWQGARCLSTGDAHPLRLDESDDWRVLESFIPTASDVSFSKMAQSVHAAKRESGRLRAVVRWVLSLTLVCAVLTGGSAAEGRLLGTIERGPFGAWFQWLGRPGTWPSDLPAGPAASRHYVAMWASLSVAGSLLTGCIAVLLAFRVAAFGAVIRRWKSGPSTPLGRTSRTLSLLNRNGPPDEEWTWADISHLLVSGTIWRHAIALTAGWISWLLGIAIGTLFFVFPGILVALFANRWWFGRLSEICAQAAGVTPPDNKSLGKAGWWLVMGGAMVPLVFIPVALILPGIETIHGSATAQLIRTSTWLMVAAILVIWTPLYAPLTIGMYAVTGRISPFRVLGWYRQMLTSFHWLLDVTAWWGFTLLSGLVVFLLIGGGLCVSVMAAIAWTGQGLSALYQAEAMIQHRSANSEILLAVTFGAGTCVALVFGLSLIAVIQSASLGMILRRNRHLPALQPML